MEPQNQPPVSPAADSAAHSFEKQPLLKPAFSLLGAHLGGILIAVVLCFSLASFMTGAGLFLCVPVILLGYCLPVYSTLWGMGHQDVNKAAFGHIALDKYRGMKISLVAMSPWFVMSILFILSKFGLFWNFVIIYKLLNAEVWPIINAIQTSMYLPDYEIWQVFLVALLPLIPIAICHIGYVLGTKDFSIMQSLVYKKKAAPQENLTTLEQFQRKQSYKGQRTEPEQKAKPSLLHKLMYQDETKKK